MMGSPSASNSTFPHEHRASARLLDGVGMRLVHPLSCISISTDYPHTRLLRTRVLPRPPHTRSSETLRRQEDARILIRQAEGRDGSRSAERRPGGGGEGDGAAHSRLLVVAPRNALKGLQAETVAVYRQYVACVRVTRFAGGRDAEITIGMTGVYSTSRNMPSFSDTSIHR